MSKKILILEDSEIIAAMHTFMIEQFLNYETIEFTNGDDAIDFITDKDKEYPDLIVVDHNLSSGVTRKTGLALLKTLKKCGVYIPVIVSSGITDERIKNKYKEMGSSAFVSKDSENYEDELLNTIKSILND